MSYLNICSFSILFISCHYSFSLLRCFYLHPLFLSLLPSTINFFVYLIIFFLSFFLLRFFSNCLAPLSLSLLLYLSFCPFLLSNFFYFLIFTFSSFSVSVCLSVCLSLSLSLSLSLFLIFLFIIYFIHAKLLFIPYFLIYFVYFFFLRILLTFLIDPSLYFRICLSLSLSLPSYLSFFLSFFLFTCHPLTCLSSPSFVMPPPFSRPWIIGNYRIPALPFHHHYGYYICIGSRVKRLSNELHAGRDQEGGRSFQRPSWPAYYFRCFVPCLYHFMWDSAKKAVS